MRLGIRTIFGSLFRSRAQPAEEAEAPLGELTLPDPGVPGFMIEALTRSEPGLAAGPEPARAGLILEQQPAPPAEEAAPTLEAASAYRAAGESLRALLMFQGLAAAEPGLAAAWYGIGMLQHEAGAYAAARIGWERCVAADPDHVDAIFRLGNLDAYMGHRLAAVARLEALLARRPELTEVRVRLAEIYGWMNWWDRAQAAHGQIEETLNGWMEHARQRVVRVIEAERQKLAALDEKRAEDGVLTWADRLRRAQSQFKLGDMTFCLWATANLALQSPTAFAPCRLRARVLVREEGLATGIAYLRGLEATFAADRSYRLTLAELLHEDGAYGEAADVLASLVAASPSHEAFRLMAQGALCRDDPDALGRVSRAWLAFDSGETGPCVFAIAAARSAGRVARLSDLPDAQSAAGVRLVQFWDAADVPADVAETMASWRRFHPGATHEVFDSARARALIAATGERDLLDGYDAATHPAMQSDLFRLVYLAQSGGVYLDADELCRRSMARVFAALGEMELVAWLSTETPPYAFNGFMAVRPGSAIVRDALAEAVRLLTRHRAEGVRSDMWQVTGPGLLTRAIGRAVADPARAGQILLLSDGEYRSFAATNEELAYKHTQDGNWRLG